MLSGRPCSVSPRCYTTLTSCPPSISFRPRGEKQGKEKKGNHGVLKFWWTKVDLVDLFFLKKL